MIGAVAAVALMSASSGGASEVDYLTAALSACTVRDEKSALACLRRQLPRQHRQAIIDAEAPLLAGAGELKAAVRHAFGDDLHRHYKTAGYRVDEGIDAAELLVDSYWLDGRGCRYSRRDRIRIENESLEAELSAAAFVAEAEAEGGSASATVLYEPLPVTCWRWEQPAR